MITLSNYYIHSPEKTGIVDGIPPINKIFKDPKYYYFCHGHSIIREADVGLDKYLIEHFYLDRHLDIVGSYLKRCLFFIENFKININGYFLNVIFLENQALRLASCFPEAIFNLNFHDIKLILSPDLNFILKIKEYYFPENKYALDVLTGKLPLPIYCDMIENSGILDKSKYHKSILG